MALVKSIRAKKILETPRFFQSETNSTMKKYPDDRLNLWIGIEWEMNNVKNLSFTGDLTDTQKVMIESMANLLIGKPITKLDDLSVRECEAFLRDRNSEKAIEELSETEEVELRKIFQWVRAFPRLSPSKDYTFPSEKGPFSSLKLVDKIREIKAFLNSPEVLTLYENLPRPELVDVEDLTVYIHAPYNSQREKSLFEKLHIRGVEVFQEENLNFIPEAS